MIIKNTPDDINAEILIGNYPDETFDVLFKGSHNRNAYKDIIGIDVRKKRLQLTLGRNSLYNKLPESLFHPIDRFNKTLKKEELSIEQSKQEAEEDNAYRFFYPIDIMLLGIRVDVRKAIQRFVSENKVMQDIIGDNLTERQRNNRFINRTLVYLPICKNIRGDRTLLTLLIRKVFRDEAIYVEIDHCNTFMYEQSPRYPDAIGDSLNEIYLGCGYDENVLSYKIHYWSEDDCDANFLLFIDEIEDYRLFIQDFFMSVESQLEFDIRKDEKPLKLSDDNKFNYLDFNTNI